MSISVNHWQKLGAMSLLLLANASHANTYIVDTLGGAALQPLVQNQLNQLPSGGNVMVYQDRLVINTTPQNYAEISQFIRQIDKQLQTLTVLVRVGEHITNYDHNGYGNIGVINHQVYVNGRWENNQNQTTGNQLYQVQTLSGKSASIGLEQILQTPTIYTNDYSGYNAYNGGYHRNYPYPAYPQVVIGTTLLSANQGISVTPTVMANGKIQVQIAQANDKVGTLGLGNGNRQTVVNGQKISSTITVNPNQWTTIGYINNQTQTNGTYGKYSQAMQTPIQIMVY